jgi:hypothetical protein
VVGSLLSSPPAPRVLKSAIQFLADKTWSHPVGGRDVQFAAATVERWYYAARHKNDDPVGALRRAVRRDRGKISLAAPLAGRLMLQHRDHPDWSYQLHFDNLAALVKAEPGKTERTPTAAGARLASSHETTGKLGTVHAGCYRAYQVKPSEKFGLCSWHAL